MIRSRFCNGAMPRWISNPSPRLLESLDAPPPERGLGRARPASDAIALRHLAGEAEIQALATSRAAVRRLWEVCQLPDFRKLSADEHAKMVRTLFLFLMSDDGHIPDDWMARQIARLDVSEGDVATLSGRLAQIRTFTYAAHRPGWTRDSAHWQGETRAVEDRLSDALHEQTDPAFHRPPHIDPDEASARRRDRGRDGWKKMAAC